MNKNIFKFDVLCFALALFAAQNAYSAANFNITPSGTLPTTVAIGQTVSAVYIVTNQTPITLNGYILQGLPATVTQNTAGSNCGNPIHLVPRASCRLQLDITAPVTSNFAICKAESCTTAAVPLNIALSTAPRFAYVTQGYNAGVQVCTVNNSDGSLSACTDAGGNLSSIYPQGIVVDSAGTHAYISAGFTNERTVTQCVINQTNGTFTSCSSTTIIAPAGYQPYYGLLTLNSSSTLAYLVDYHDGDSNRVLACPINNGVISATCTDTGANQLTSDNVGIALNSSNTTAYIGGYGNSYVTVCAVNGATFSNCAMKTGGGAISFSEPAGVALNPANTILYIADNVSHNIFACDTTPNVNSTFNNCFLTGGLPNNQPQPWSITLNQAGTVAYIADYNSIVYSCAILEDGTFSTCTQNTGFPQPVNVALTY